MRRTPILVLAVASTLLVALWRAARRSPGRTAPRSRLEHGGSVWLSAAFREARATAVLPRDPNDSPDDVAGPQIHVIYALPSDGTDRSLDQDGTLTGTVASWNAWLAGQTGGRNFRLDTSSGMLDITFVRVPETDAQFDANGVYIRDELERQLHALGFNQPQKIYAVYYDGRSSVTCGSAPWPPDLAGNVAAMYLHGLFSGPVPCDTNRWGSVGNPGYLEFAMVHEIMHSLGFAPTCAPHHTRRGHVSEPTNDLMYAGDAFWSLPATLDVGRDDYFNAHIPGCLDLSDSPYLASVYSIAVSVSGPGKVTSSPSGIDCPETCSATFPGSVTLTAVPSAGMTFAGWTGACSGAASTCTIPSGGSVTATFTQAAPPAPRPRCTVPNVKGKTLIAARNAIRANHCSTGRIGRAYSPTVKAGRVISQSPAAGKSFPAGHKTDLVVSRGRKQ